MISQLFCPSMLFIVLPLMLSCRTIQYSTARNIGDFEADKDSIETFHETNVSLITTNQTETSSLNILLLSNGTKAKQINYSLTLNNVPKTLINSTNGIPNIIKRPTKVANSSDFVTILSKVISEKLVNILKNRLELFLSAKNSSNDSNGNINLESSKNTVQESSTLKGTESNENADELEKDSSYTSNSVKTDINKNPLMARHFVFHPYLPHGKDIMPDEKISFHDVLPIKMAKFIKSMVEDAPWEQMFMKMVRMVVDQFVDKIIDQMFAHKEGDDDKWRSMDGFQSPSWSFLKNSITSLVRLRRSLDKNKTVKEDSWDISSFSPSNRLSKDDKNKMKETPDNESWLDSILDYLFPEDKKADSSDESFNDERQKRDTDQVKNMRMEDILQTFLVKYLKFSGKLPPEGVHASVKGAILHREEQNVSESGLQVKENSTLVDPLESTTEISDLHSNDMPAALSESWSELLPRDTQPETAFPSEVLKRAKRSATSDERKEAKRLWQASHRSRPSNPKMRDECSLRRACNAGRLLARLPSVQDLTLQLKEYGNEPHWDALLWGMTKKRCSKIFCKRQRSPKGSKLHWNHPEKRFHRKHTLDTRVPRFESDAFDLTTIFPV